MVTKAKYLVTGEVVTVLKEMKFENPDYGTAVLVLDSNGNVNMAFKYLFEFEEVPSELSVDEARARGYVFGNWREYNPPLEFPDIAVKSEAEKDSDLALKRLDNLNRSTYPVGTKYTIGKGKTFWTVDGHGDGEIHVTREGKGHNAMWVKSDKLKFIK